MKTLCRKAGAILAALFIACTVAFAPSGTEAKAASSSLPFDETSIEDDLKGIDLSAYPKDGTGKHRLLDNVGFTEFGYSDESPELFGLYFYVYNPGEREISPQSGACTVNMAVSYSYSGLPNSYAKLPLELCDVTANNRIAKFRLKNSQSAYERARAYAALHDGERRYDVAGIELWFSGDRNPTDNQVSGDGVSFICSGYAAGFGKDKNAQSTLVMRREDLETVSLSLDKTFYRTKTSSLGNGHQNQVDTVWFTVPNRLIETYGRLQRIKAEWYEYRTRPVVVTSNDEFYYAVQNYIGKNIGYECNGDIGWALTWIDPSYTKDSFINFLMRLSPNTIYDIDIKDYIGRRKYKNSDCAVMTEYSHFYIDRPVFSWNNPEYIHDYLWGTKYSKQLDQLTYLFLVDNILNYDPAADIEASGGITRSRLEEYIYDYDKSFDKGEIRIGDRVLSADLFEDDIPDERKMDNERGKIQMGYSYYDFDVDLDSQEITTWNDTDPSWWESFLQYGAWWKIPDEEGRTFSPFHTLTASDLSGEDAAVAERIMVAVSDVPRLRSAYQAAQNRTDPGSVILFRFATSDYEAKTTNVWKLNDYFYPTHFEKMDEPRGGDFPWTEEMTEDDYIKLGDSVRDDEYFTGQAYYAQESVYLNFDIIQLTFNNNGDMTVLACVADPIDIISPITPPYNPAKDNFWGLVWWLGGTAAVLLILLIVFGVLERKTKI